MVLTSFQPTISSIALDIASHAIDDAGNLFVIFSGISAVNNSISLVNAAYNNNVWTQPSTFTVLSEQGNKSAYVGGGQLSSNGFNCLAVNNDFLYYYDGLNLAAYSRSTGTLITSTTFTNLLVRQQGGIAVDDCNNLYLGGNGNILCYSFNGTTFSPTTNIPLGVTGTTNQFVYDIKLDKASKVLYVCGSGFIGTYAPVHSASCPASCFSIPASQTVVLSTFSFCAGSAAAVSLANSNLITGLNYQWQVSGSPQGPFVSISGATTTAFTVPSTTSTNYYQVLITCANSSLTYSTTAIITAFGLPALQFSSNPPVICAGDSATLTVSGASTYSWSTGDSGPQIVIYPASTATFNVSGVDVNSCATSSNYAVTAANCTGIKETEKENSILVFPNPAGGVLYISYKSEKYNVSLFNVVGENVLTEKNAGGDFQLKTEKFPTGIYFVQISVDNKVVLTKKIVIE